MRLKFTKIILMLAVAGMVSACGNKTEKSPAPEQTNWKWLNYSVSQINY